MTISKILVGSTITTMAINLPKVLTDQPSFLFKSFTGYEHFQDPTLVKPTALTFPSRNGSIPYFDKFVPDKGKTLLGQAFTELSGINGHAQKFKNMGGLEMEVRTWPSTNPALGDVVEILYNGNWLPITLNPNPLPRGIHEVYFDEWFDTKLLSTVTGSLPSKNIPRLIWVNGINTVFSWTGGVTAINSITATNFLLPVGITWASLGFTTDAAGNAFVVVNQTLYQLSNPADLNTNSINVTSTAGAVAGDIATSQIETDTSPIPFDMCRNNKGYMFYGNWNQRDLYMSNAFNREFDYKIISTNALQDDLIVLPNALTSPYTGTIEETFHIVIDSTNPPPVTFSGSGANALVFNTSGYTQVGINNKYKVLVTIIPQTVQADTNWVQYDLSTVTTQFIQGETITGGTSGNTATVGIDDQTTGYIFTSLHTLPFTPGETITGGTSGSTAVVMSDTINPNSYRLVSYWVYKNDVLVGVGSQLTNPAGQPNVGPFAVTDGITFDVPINVIGNLTPLVAGFDNFLYYDGSLHDGDSWELNVVNQQGADTFSWQSNNGPITSNVLITGGLQNLQNGVQIQFNNLNGHSVGDYWDVLATPSVTRAFDNFYYAVPIRRPGEGYKFRLSSNFWTMDTQEENMYVNQSYGEWAYVSTILSSDLTTESVDLTPLKQAGALKVIFPYMTGHINDQLVFVTVDKRLQTLGREQFLEKPQSGYLSELVNLDFQESSFEGGSIKYLDKMLYVSSPKEGVTHAYNTYLKYWNPPKSFAEVGIMTIIGNTLACHSQTRNQSYTMFTSTSGDDGQSYTVEMRTAMYDVGDRWDNKSSSMSMTEGYIEGNPQLIHTAYLGVEGCGGILSHPIEPIVCAKPDFAPFGQGSFGTHPFGSDVGISGSYFQEIWKRYAPNMEYYFISTGIVCSAKTHSWAILATGYNGMYNVKGNNSLVAPSNKVL